MTRFLKSTLLIALCVIILTSCNSTLVSLKYENSRLVNNFLGLSYVAAPFNYQAVSTGEAYGYYKNANLTLYEISGLDPKKWLTEEYSGASTTLFHSDKITLPTLRELGATKIFICLEGEIIYSLATVEDVEIINKVIDLFENGESAEWPIIDSIQRYEFKFYSEDNYPYLYYNLSYGEFPEGRFLYDRTTKRCVELGDLLLEYTG